MAETFELEIATPERLIERTTAREAEIPAANGYIGVLPEHSPLLAGLGTGEMWFVDGERKRRTLVLAGGWVEVLPTHVRVLADRAERAGEVDVPRAEKAFQRASERLAHPGEQVDIARALNAMKRAQARLEAARHK